MSIPALPKLPPDVVDGYLARLGLEAEPPSVAAMTRIHQRHVERVPWETVWIHEGSRWGIDPATSAGRIAATGRGGYCFHLNGALAALLATLGYDVGLHVGGVHDPEGPDPEMLTNHLALTVAGLATDECPSGRWYVDVGLGDALHAPVPLAAGAIPQPPFTMALETVPAAGVGDWHLAHDPQGAFGGMSFLGSPASMTAFDEKHRWLSTAPESGFVRFLVVQRRTVEVADGLRGLVRTVVSPAGVDVTVIEERTAWFALLADGFGLVPSGDLDGLWSRVAAAHEAWAAQQG